LAAAFIAAIGATSPCRWVWNGALAQGLYRHLWRHRPAAARLPCARGRLDC